MLLSSRCHQLSSASSSLRWYGIEDPVVEEGEAATAPVDPTRDGYTFTGWDKDFSNITADLTVTAKYEEIPSNDLTITVGNASVAAGETVDIIVSLKNNPGIVSMTLKLNYDESVMTLTSVTKGNALSEMTFTKPRDLGSGCQLPWDAEFVLPEDATNASMKTTPMSR